MADDFLLAAVTGALEGFGNVYVPYKRAQYEDLLTRRRLQEQSILELGQKRQILSEEDVLTRAREQEKFRRESFIGTEELPPETAELLKAQPGQRFRKEAIPSTLGYLGRTETVKLRRDEVTKFNKVRLLQFRKQLLDEKRKAEENGMTVDAYVLDMLDHVNKLMEKSLGVDGSGEFNPPPAKRTTELDKLFEGIK